MMDELLIGLLVMLLLAVPIGIIVLLIVALVRTQRIGELSERLHRVERELGRARLTVGEAVTDHSVTGDAAALLERLHGLEHEVRRLREQGQRPAEELPPMELPAPVEPRERRHPRPIPVATLVEEPHLPKEPNWAAVEAWIGRHGLGWAAVVLLVFAVGFFLKHVFERNLIGELGRVAIGVVIGSGLAVAGYGFHRRGWRLFSQMLTAGGVAVLYLATFASFGYYRLIDEQPASLFLTALVAEAFLLAVLYDAPAIALMAVIGGLLAPVLLHTDVDRYRSLFAYLAVLDAGVVVLVIFRRWWAIASVALVGTHLLFWAWHWEHYHPAKLAVCLVFQGGIFTLFAGQALFSHAVRRQRANIEDLIRLMANAFLVALAGYVLLDDRYHHWLGTLSLGMAICFTVQVWLVQSAGSGDPLYEFILFAIAMSFLAMVFPLQGRAVWIAVGWTAQGLTLWWFGVRAGGLALRALGAALLALATLRLLIVNTIAEPAHVEPFIPVMNGYGLPALLIAGSLVAAALLVRRNRPAFGSADFVSMRILGLAGVALTWIVLSVEAHDYFVVQIDQPPGLQTRGGVIEREMEPRQWEAYRFERAVDLRYTAQVAMSVVWAVYAALVLLAGFRLDNRPLRWVALGLFGLTLGKVVLIDMGRLPGFYRVAAFLALSLMMGGAAWGYQKLKHAFAGDNP